MRKLLKLFTLALMLMVTGLMLVACGNSKQKAEEPSQETINENSICLVTFNSCGGNEIDNQEITENGKAEKVYPRRDGYEFMGWYIDETYSEKFDFNQKVESDVTLFAKWSYKLEEIYDFEFRENSNSYMIIKYYGESDDLYLPSKFNGFPVSSIDRNVFQGNEELRKILIPESITYIGVNAFESCSNLQELQIMGNVSEYGNSAFGECGNLQKIYFATQQNVGTYGEWNNIFFNAGANTNGITLTIDPCVHLPANLLRPHNDIKLPNITSIEVKPGIETYKYYTFSVFTNDKLPFVEEIQLGNNIESIAANAFNCYVNLSSIIIPDTVRSFGYDAFANCSRLSKMNYLGTLDEWTRISFENAKSNPTYWTKSLIINGEEIIDVFLSENILVKHIVDNGIEYDIQITPGEIGNYAFYNCENLNSVVIPRYNEYLTNIGKYAFYGCKSLTSIFIPVSVHQIQNFAFTGCDLLTIYCEVESQKPDVWGTKWNSDNRPVVWGYQPE